MQKMKEMLMESIFEVFEKMYYVFLEPLDSEQGKYDMTASIDFRGHVKGGIRIFFSKELARKMAQNMLNLGEGDVTGKLVEDCVKESANMICGNFLHKLDSSRAFDQTLPKFDGGPVIIDYSEAAPPVKLAFESDGHGVGVNMYMTDQRL